MEDPRLAGWRLDAFASVAEDPGRFGTWRGGEVQGGMTHMPWFELSDDAAAFQLALYDRGWVRPSIPWMAWADSPRGQELLYEPRALARASEDEVAAVLTTLVRADHFGEGNLQGGVERGVVAAALRRIRELARDRTTLVVQRLDQGPRLVIEDADRFARFWFEADEASSGPNAFDAFVGTTDPVRIVSDDIRAINRTMRARSPHEKWAAFTNTAASLPWLEALPRDLSLFDIDQAAWDETWAARLTAPIEALSGPHRGLAVITKILHAKRPRLYPVLDSLVLQLLGATGRPVVEILDHIRGIGRMNEPTLRLIARELRTQGPAGRRTRVRILDGILWTAHPGSSLTFEPGEWERRIGRGGHS